MSPVITTTGSLMRRVSVGAADGLGWVTAPRKTGEHAPTASATIADRTPLLAGPSPMIQRGRGARVRQPGNAGAQPPRAVINRRACSSGCDSGIAALAAREVERAQHLVGAIELVVDDQVLVLAEVRELVDRLGQAALDHRGRVGRAAAQALGQRAEVGRQDEDLERVVGPRARE